MIYITGDTHRRFTRLLTTSFTKEDILIILGDACINYYLDNTDNLVKDFLSKYNNNFFIIQGNHEERPENIKTYKEKEMYGGKVYIEDEYPNLIFAKNGEFYNIENNRFLVIGGAYSVDKYQLLKNKLNWFKEEQLTNKEKKNIINKCTGEKVDYILSHTCPYKYIPREAFLPGIDERLVDNSMEYFLDKIEEIVSYDKWYCGHYHISKEIDKLEFLHYDIKEISKTKEKEKSIIKK